MSLAGLLAAGAYVFFESMSVPDANRAALKDELQSEPATVIAAGRSEMSVSYNPLGNVMPFNTVAFTTPFIGIAPCCAN